MIGITLRLFKLLLLDYLACPCISCYYRNNNVFEQILMLSIIYLTATAACAVPLK